MNSDIYQQQILDHNRTPRNFHELEKFTHKCVGHNPLCGDQLSLQLFVNGDTLEDVAFTGDGCAISKASASMMTMSVKGKTVQEAKQLFEVFRQMIVGDSETGNKDALHGVDKAILGKLSVFETVKLYPSRVKCAVLGWYALAGALENKQITATDKRSL